MPEDFNLPHWIIGDRLPSSGDVKFDSALDDVKRAVHENFEEMISQTTRRFQSALVHEPEEALGEVTTTSGSYVSLSGGPSITVARG
jgi:hypothetical protein